LKYESSRIVACLNFKMIVYAAQEKHPVEICARED
jgi:hypothetical protein